MEKVSVVDEVSVVEEVSVAEEVSGLDGAVASSEQGGKMSISTIKAMTFPFLNGNFVSSRVQESSKGSYL